MTNARDGWNPETEHLADRLTAILRLRHERDRLDQWDRVRPFLIKERCYSDRMAITVELLAHEVISIPNRCPACGSITTIDITVGEPTVSPPPESQRCDGCA